MTQTPDTGDAGLPGIDERRAVPRIHRPVVLVAVIGSCLGLVSTIIGITVLGMNHQGVNEVATTALSAIGATLAGGFAGWIGRGGTRSGSGRRDSDG